MIDKLKEFFNKTFEGDCDNPYCTVCNNCGENGCCDPLGCDPTNPKCKYPDSKDIEIKDLREYIAKLESERK